MARHNRSLVRAAAAAAVLGAAGSGCSDPDLAGQAIPHVEIGPVETPYGVRLDADATPEQVVYAFLKAARDDFRAAQRGNSAEQQAALMTQLRLAAANRIKQAVDRLYERDTLAVEHNRDEAVYKVVRYWTPMVAYYVPDVGDDQASALMDRMRTTTMPDGNAQVRIDVQHQDSRATLEFRLAREPGDVDLDKRYWRIYAVGFVDPRGEASPAVISRRARSGALALSGDRPGRLTRCSRAGLRSDRERAYELFDGS